LTAVLLAVLAGCGDKKPGNDGIGLFPKNFNPNLDPFDPNVLTSYRLSMDPGDWNAIVANPQDNTWRHAILDWQGETWNNVAVRPAGQRARVPGNLKPTIRIKFNWFVPHRKFHSLYVTGLRLGSDTMDPAMMRRRLEDGIYRATGLPAPRCVHGRVYVNDAYTGLYVVEERESRGFVKEHFSNTNINQLWDFNPDADAFPGHNDDVTWAGPDPSLYVPHLLHPRLRKLDRTNLELKAPFPEQVRDFVETVNTQPWSAISQAVHIDHFCRFMAAEVVTGEADGYVAFRVSGAPPFRSANFRIYPDPSSGKWVVLAWDRDEGYWATRASIVTGFDQRVLTQNLILADPSAIARYRDFLSQLVQGAASVASMNAQLDFIVAQVQDAAAEDPYKTAGSTENWLAHVQTIRNFVAQQNAMILSQLSQ
jgi:spore coat protein CotH